MQKGVCGWRRASVFAKQKAILLCVFLCAAFAAWGQTTAFTYQGQLKGENGPVNGSYDLEFTLYSTNSDGCVAEGAVTNTAVVVNNGLFVTTIDFGAGVFVGGDTWLEIGVRTNGDDVFNILTPRQPLTSVPNASFAALANTANVANTAAVATVAMTASNFSGTLPVGQLSGLIPVESLTGSLPLAQLPDSLVTNNDLRTLSFPGGLILPPDMPTDTNAAVSLTNAWAIFTDNTIPIDSLAEPGVTNIFGVGPDTNLVKIRIGAGLQLDGDGNLTASGVGTIVTNVITRDFVESNLFVMDTNALLLDFAHFDTFKIFQLTNANIELTNVSCLHHAGHIYIQLDTNGTWLTESLTVAGGLLATNGNFAFTTNANDSFVIEVLPGFFSANVMCDFKGPYSGSMPFTNSLSVPIENTGGGGGDGGGGVTNPPPVIDPLLTNGLIAYYNFDTSDGVTVEDVSGNGHTATIEGGVTLGEPHIGTNSLSFDGFTGYVLGDASSATEPGSGLFSAMVWFKTFDSSADRILISKVGTNMTYYSIQLANTSGAIIAAVQGEQAGVSAVTNIDQNWADGNWHLAILNFDGGQTSLSIDGASFVTSMDVTIGPVDPGGSLVIGQLGVGGGMFWDGFMDEVGLYDRMLLDSEAASLFGQTHP